MSNCSNCPAWTRFDVPEKPDLRVGHCRMKPPVVIVKSPDVIDSHFPMVTADHWCIPGRRLMREVQIQETSQEVERSGSSYGELE